MEIPGDAMARTRWAKELIDACSVSRQSRMIQARQMRQLYYMGTLSGGPSKYNRCFSHVDKLSSFIFSPADVRFTLEYSGSDRPSEAEKAKAAGRYVSRKFRRAKCGQGFSATNEISLVEGAGIIKATWGPGGRVVPIPIRPTFFGVLREDREELSEQEAFCHTFYITKDGFRRMVANHRDRAELMRQVQTAATPQNTSDVLGDSYFHEIVAGGMAPISYTGAAGSSGPQFGAVAVVAPMVPMLSPEVANDLIRVDDLWVWNDEQEDWTTIRYVDPGLMVEGKYQLRNLGDCGKGKHPYTKVCTNRTPGNFWGRSELAVLYEPQMQLNKLTDNIAMIFNLRARPPRAFSGFQSITDEKAKALLSPGGTITEAAIGAKVDDLAPEMPPEALAYLGELKEIFNEVAGFTNLLSGEGEPGVRAGVHAGVLLRTSTPRLRDRALLAETQCSDFGNVVLSMLRQKDPTPVFPGEGDEFTLKQLPEDCEVTVDSHTSSPAFVEDNRQMAYSLAKAEAIDGETLIEMLHPPREELLISRLRARQRAQAEFAAKHPELAAERAKKK